MDTLGTQPFVLYREVVLFWRLFCIECIYKGTFRLSFIERFVLFQSVIYREQKEMSILEECKGTRVGDG